MSDTSPDRAPRRALRSHGRERVAWNRRHSLILAFAVAFVLVFVFCLGMGRLGVPFGETLKIMVNDFTPFSPEQTWTDMQRSAIVNVRLPRLVGASLVGAALALSGAAYQGIFKNPLVSPDLLGISNGACVGAAAAILLGLPSLGIQFSALVMGLVTVFVTTRIPRFFHNSSSLMLVLAGVIMSGLMSSLLGVAKYVADPDDNLAEIVYWTMGSFANIRMSDVLIVAPAIVIAGIVLIAMRWRIGLLSLGEQEAKSLGVDIKRTRGLAILCSTVLTACAVCMCGTIGWVGLIIPHLSRLVIGHDNRYAIPLAGLLGAVFMVVVDTVARCLTGSEIPLSIITGLLGAPLFVWLLARQRTRIS